MVATSSHSTASSDASSGPILLAKSLSVGDVKTPYVMPEHHSVRLYPTQMRFVTGIARAYDDDFPPELSGLVHKEDFETAINQINNTMKDYWPCFFCMCCGYACAPCTLGISLLCPNLCIRDVRYPHDTLQPFIYAQYLFSSSRPSSTCGRLCCGLTNGLALPKPESSGGSCGNAAGRGSIFRTR
jgi:hypothetical protein